MAQQFRQGAGRHHLAAVHAGAGPEVDDVVGRRMVSSSCSTTSTELPRALQFVQRGQQLLVVPGVQADGGLVQDVEHPAQVRAELGRQPDALASPPESVGTPRPKLQIAQPDLAQKFSRSRISGRMSRAIRAARPCELEPPKQLDGPPPPACAERSSMVGPAAWPARRIGGSLQPHRAGDGIQARAPGSPGRARVCLPAIRTRIPRWRRRARRGPHPAGRTVRRSRGSAGTSPGASCS